jgi:hypothetical protein
MAWWFRLGRGMATISALTSRRRRRSCAAMKPRVITERLTGPSLWVILLV